MPKKKSFENLKRNMKTKNLVLACFQLFFTHNVILTSEINVSMYIKSGYPNSTAVCPGYVLNFTFTRTNATITSIDLYSSVNLELLKPMRKNISSCRYTNKDLNLTQPDIKYVKNGFCFIEIMFLEDKNPMEFQLNVVDNHGSQIISKKFHKQVDFQEIYGSLSLVLASTHVTKEIAMVSLTWTKWNDEKCNTRSIKYIEYEHCYFTKGTISNCTVNEIDVDDNTPECTNYNFRYDKCTLVIKSDALSPLTNYSYRIRYTLGYSSHYSDWSNRVNFTTPSIGPTVPVRLGCILKEGGLPELNWTKPSDTFIKNLDQFIVRVKQGDELIDKKTVSVTSPATSNYNFLYEKIMIKTEFYVQACVTTKNKDYCSPNSNVCVLSPKDEISTEKIVILAVSNLSALLVLLLVVVCVVRYLKRRRRRKRRKMVENAIKPREIEPYCSTYFNPDGLATFI